MSDVGWDDVEWLWRAWRIQRAMKRGAAARRTTKLSSGYYVYNTVLPGAPKCCGGPTLRVFSRDSWHCPRCHTERPQ